MNWGHWNWGWVSKVVDATRKRNMPIFLTTDAWSSAYRDSPSRYSHWYHSSPERYSQVNRPHQDFTRREPNGDSLTGTLITQPMPMAPTWKRDGDKHLPAETTITLVAEVRIPNMCHSKSMRTMASRAPQPLITEIMADSNRQMGSSSWYGPFIRCSSGIPAS